MSMPPLRKLSTVVLGSVCIYTAHIQGYLVPALKIVLGLSTLFLGALYWNQDKLLYIPDPDPVNFPKHFHTDPWKAAKIPFDNVIVFPSDEPNLQLKGWFMKQRNPKQNPTIVFLHANAGSIVHRLQLFAQIYRSCYTNILAVEYRGYGENLGTPNEDGLKKDALAFVLDYLVKSEEVDFNQVFIMGRSLGGAVAIWLAAECEKRDIRIKGLILENTFMSINHMATTLMPFLSPLSPLLKRPILLNEWRSIDEISHLKKTPILFLSGRKDELVPKGHMDALFAKMDQGLKSRSVFVEIEDGGHNDTPVKGGIKYFTAINSFLVK